ncbi:hypothetical protein B0H14DRAFT_2559751 [Mycena olivaceomarginata]|nr:hypothetical protein B0H14DRAFT_2559751 [Mycena olivaceomarginata]
MSNASNFGRRNGADLHHAHKELEEDSSTPRSAARHSDFRFEPAKRVIEELRGESRRSVVHSGIQRRRDRLGFLSINVENEMNRALNGDLKAGSHAGTGRRNKTKLEKLPYEQKGRSLAASLLLKRSLISRTQKSGPKSKTRGGYATSIRAMSRTPRREIDIRSRRLAENVRPAEQGNVLHETWEQRILESKWKGKDRSPILQRPQGKKPKGDDVLKQASTPATDEIETAWRGEIAQVLARQIRFPEKRLAVYNLAVQIPESMKGKMSASKNRTSRSRLREREQSSRAAMELSAEWPSTTLWRPALLNDLSASISEYLVDNHVAFWTLTPSESRTLGPKAPSGVLMRGASVGGLAGSPPQDDGAHLQVLLSAPGGSSETRTQVLPVVLFAHPYCDGALDGRADWTFPQTPVGSGGGADIGHISLDPLYSGVTCTMRTRWTARRSCLHGLGLCTGEGILDADGRKWS